MFKLAGDLRPVSCNEQVEDLGAAHEFAMPVPKSLARLVVSAGGGDQMLPGVSRMVELVGEGGFP